MSAGGEALRRLSFFAPREGENGIRVKICGLTTMAQAEAVAGLGVDALGFNFWPRSKRYLAPGPEREALAELEAGVTRVGLFVNAEAAEVESAFERGWIDAAQFHGDESNEEIEAWLERGFPVFRATGVRDESSLDALAAIPGPALLLDAYAPTEYGGTGERFDWALGARAVEADSRRVWILAGGLTPDTVAEAICQVNPFAVDVASGVEAAPGVKDLALSAAFIAAAKAAG